MKTKKHCSGSDEIIIYTRSEKDAKRVFLKWFKIPYNPNTKKAEIKKGHLIIQDIKKSPWSSFNFPLKEFWETCGYHPILIGTSYFKKRYYDYIVSKAIRFIQE